MSRRARVKARLRVRSRRDEGFTLIEMVIALMLLVIVLAAFANAFVGSGFAASDARFKEVAVTFADSALDEARAVTPASTLLTDGAAAGTVPAVVDLSNTTGTVVLAPQTSKLDNVTFTANLYAGSCYLPSSGSGICGSTDSSGSAPMIRVIADVTWSAQGCGSQGCSYVASTLISNGQDSVLNINPDAAPGAPTLTGAVAGDVSGNAQVVLTWSAPTVSDYPITGYIVTYTGGSGGVCVPQPATATTCTATGLTFGTTYTFQVTANSAGGTSVPSNQMQATPVDPPTQPTNVQGTPGNDQVAVTWTASTDDDNLPITYTVSATNGSGTSCTTSSATSCTVTGLTNGTSYTFTVTATTTAGSATSAASPSVTPTDPPGAPYNVNASPGSGKVTVSWTAPTSDYPISGYTVTATNTATGASAGSCVASSTATSCSVTGLSSGVNYTFTVTATSSGGVSPASQPATATPVGPPSAPTNVTATPGNGQVTVSWSVPTSADPITGYTVSGGTGCTTSSTSCTVTGLTNGTTYTFTVTATSAAGTSPASSSASAEPIGPPGAPTNVKATAGNGQVTVSWSAPSSTGGDPITGYTVSGGTGCSTTGATSCTVTGLTNGTTYTFTVTATSAAGTSPASSSASAEPIGPPGAPTNVKATAGNGQVTVSWSAPSSTGGDPITGYTVSGGTGCTTSSTSCTVTGLTNGTTYTFTVTATSAAGTSPASSSASAEPIGPPGAPTNVKATAGNGQAAVSWSAPSSNGGDPITGYTVTATASGRTTETCTTTSATSCTVTGLSNNVTYTISVTATSAAGTSSAATTTVKPEY